MPGNLFKNVSGQSYALYCETSGGAPVIGDAGNMTARAALNFGTPIPLSAGAPTEWHAIKAPGWYILTLSQSETNADNILLGITSTTGTTICKGELVGTVAPNFTSLQLDSSGLVFVNTNYDKAGYSLSSAGITAIWDEVLEGARSARKFMRLMLSVLVGKVSGLPGAPAFRDPADTKDRVVATTDANGNRSAVTLTDT